MGMLVGMAFQNCAEPWMAELKRHRDVPKERVLEGCPPTAMTPEFKQEGIDVKGVRLWDCFSNKLTANPR